MIYRNCHIVNLFVLEINLKFVYGTKGEQIKYMTAHTKTIQVSSQK